MFKTEWMIVSLLSVMFVGLVIASGCSLDGRAIEGADSGGGVGVAETTAARGTKVGSLAPDFELTRVDGTKVTLEELRGNPSVLVFWTAWCPSCEEEAPHINKLAADYEERGVRVLGINIMDSEARTAGGIKDFNIRYPVARDPDARVTRTYNVTGTPTVIFLDREGVVRYFGNELPGDYRERLDALLAEGGRG